MKFDSITDESICAFLELFYVKIRQDPVLALIFDEALGERWDHHIKTMRYFWRSAMRIGERYKGDMLVAHQKVGKLQRSLFPRWLALFQETAIECFAEEPARILYERAVRIARNLETAIFPPPVFR